jgi:5-methylcytosine-specific restriction endonuclease McrA
MYKKIGEKICGDCGELIVNIKRKHHNRNKDGLYRCEECQDQRWKRLKKEATDRHRKTDRWRETKRRSSKKERDSNLELARLREWLVKVRRRANKYGCDHFRKPKTREFAKELLALEKRCQLCGTEEDLTIDHIYPLSKAPKDRLEEFAIGLFNLQHLCRPCNGKKWAHI